MIINSFIFASAPSYTARTTAFATATAITDTTILNALNTFDLGLISNGLASKMKAVYPFVGSTATTQKYNFMDARDLDIAFRLQFNGGWSFSNNGALPNGTNTFANTYLNGTNLNLYNTHLSYYSRTQSLQALNIEMGADKDPNANQLLCLILPRSSGSAIAVHTSQVATATAIATSQTITQGLFINNRNGSLATDLKLIRNGTILATASTNGTNIISAIGNVYIGALNNDPNSGQFFSNKEVAFSSIGNGLTDGEASTFYSLVQAFQTSLSRQV